MTPAQRQPTDTDRTYQAGRPPAADGGPGLHAEHGQSPDGPAPAPGSPPTGPTEAESRAEEHDAMSGEAPTG